MEAQPCMRLRDKRGAGGSILCLGTSGFFRQCPAWLHLRQNLNSDASLEGTFPGTLCDADGATSNLPWSPQHFSTPPF